MPVALDRFDGVVVITMDREAKRSEADGEANFIRSVSLHSPLTGRRAHRERPVTFEFFYFLSREERERQPIETGNSRSRFIYRLYHK